jgi:RNA polymerase sigma-70 factor (ECF subfamily)
LKAATACSPVNDAPATDLAELNALQDGDDAALNRLIARWERRLFGFAWRYVRNTADAQDLVATVFVKLYQQRAGLRRDTNVSAWLFTTLTNLCHNLHRWRGRHAASSLDAAETGSDAGLAIAVDAPLPGEVLAHKETLDALGVAIDRLPPDLKATLLLYHYERLSYREIAEITGCSEGGVDTRLYRARARLREALGAQSERA